ncbi:MAG: hydrogenase expression/formation protein HypE [cyanobacterium endosymbiont of Rhopalodia musculus]|uniref:hydrogenase expression/formation protein HypE n=1 Tax=cyanobacterium endosymbiont of Epithemia clementina EcSB TaxID=3034674 RepID=UPI0024804D45|nr:hydrogenase expression/formation protein HypE [cyanobacterium endosymbiont of Epithemia clementina EcSB]WGT66939.1 hydrogenase expression/formation protein HypE [cyanobacterium endosymbiont of Epithemia clementina EcSB]
MTDFNLTCPIPLDQYPQVLLAHGGGGKLMQQLLEKMIFPVFNMTQNTPPHDSAVFDLNANKIAFTTDSYVIHPLFFPGGDIGSLAINGTVNDLAMSGARPLYLSVGFILEEGLPMEILWKVVQSLQNSAQTAQVEIITGDTKVVDRGKGDGVFINTAGVGIIEHDQIIAAQSVQPGDAILLSGDLGRHGIAIMAVREGLEFETTIESDCAPLNSVVLAMLESKANIHCLRDLTRGGLASALNEIAMGAGVILNIQENAIPVREDVQGACEILGFDPLYVANEGRFVAFIPQDSVDTAMKIMRAHQQDPCIIGQVTGRGPGMGLVTLESKIGASRIVDMLSGEQLPRIC